MDDQDSSKSSRTKNVPGYPKVVYALTGHSCAQGVCNTPEELEQFQIKYGGVVQSCSIVEPLSMR